MPSGQKLIISYVYFIKIKFFDWYSSRCLLYYDLADKAISVV